MIPSAPPPVTLSEAPELLDAYRILKAALKRIGDEGNLSNDARRANRLGQLEHAVEVAKDAVFDVLNVASSSLKCPAAATAMDDLQGRAPAGSAARFVGGTSGADNAHVGTAGAESEQ